MVCKRCPFHGTSFTLWRAAGGSAPSPRSRRASDVVRHARLLSNYEMWRFGWIRHTGASRRPVSTLHTFFKSPVSLPAETRRHASGIGGSERLWHALLCPFESPESTGPFPSAVSSLRHPGAALESRVRPAPTRLAILTWLTLPVVICLSQRLSHGNISYNFLAGQ